MGPTKPPESGDFCQRFARAFRALEETIVPKNTLTQSDFVRSLSPSQIAQVLRELPKDTKNMSTKPAIDNTAWINEQYRLPMGELETAVFDYIRKKPGASYNSIVNNMSASKKRWRASVVRSSLYSLLSKGLLKASAPTDKKSWGIGNDVFQLA